jgi:hypothetical protein
MGAYGNKPDDANPGRYDPGAVPAKPFRNPVHCADVSKDGFLYVCDRMNDRIQVFRKGWDICEGSIHCNEDTAIGFRLGHDVIARSAPNISLCRRRVNEKIYIVDRSTLQVLTSFGDGGRQPGQFFGGHNLAIDSKGNIYTTETYTGARVQRFLYKGLGGVAKEQGVTWPKP